MSTLQSQSDAQARVDRLCLAYARVFGNEQHRSEDQVMVMQDMEHRGYLNRSTMTPDSTGAVCEHRMQSAEGQRIFVLQTKELIRRAKTSEKKPKPSVKKS